MENLPVEISSDIFSRLSVDTVLECKRVCRTWRNLLSSVDHKTNFAALHLLRHTHHQHHHSNGAIVSSKVSDLGLIFLRKSENPKATSHPLYYGEFDENNGSNVQNTVRLINHPNIQTTQKLDTSSVIASCNGLICFVEIGKRGIKDPIHICNPVTRECVSLEGFNENNEYLQDVRGIHSGFGYLSQTNEYKVVRIVCSIKRQIQVYTLGGGSGWRNKGVINGVLRSMCGVFFNGALHWLDGNGKDIMVFNLSDENIHVLPLPAEHDNDYEFTTIIGSFGGWLCVSGCKSKRKYPLECI